MTAHINEDEYRFLHNMLVSMQSQPTNHHQIIEATKYMESIVETNLVTKVIVFLKIINPENTESTDCTKIQAAAMVRDLVSKKSKKVPTDPNIEMLKKILLHVYINTNDKRVHQQLVTVIARVVKITSLESWKELFEIYRSPEFLQNESMLLLMLEIINTLSQQRLPMARRKFALVISEILPFGFFSSVLENIVHDNRGVLFIKLFIKYLKNCIQLTPPMVTTCSDLCKTSANILLILLKKETSSTTNLSQPVIAALLKLCYIIMVKIELLQINNLEEKIVELTKFWLDNTGLTSKYSSKIKINWLEIVKNLFKNSSKYQSKMKSDFVLNTILNIANNFFPYSPEEIEEFTADAEDHFFREMNEGHEASIFDTRKNAEAVFVAGLIWFRDNDKHSYGRNLYHRLLNIELNETANNAGLIQILRNFEPVPETRFVCINTFCTIAFDMKNEQVFNHIKPQETVQNLCYVDENGLTNITGLKRFLWLVRSVTECSNFTDGKLVELAEVVQHFLRPQYPKCIQLEAAHSILYVCIYELSLVCMKKHSILAIADNLFGLVQECKETGAKIELLRIIRNLAKIVREVEKNDRVPGDLAKKFLDLLEQLWLEAGDQTMFKSNLLGLTQNLLVESELMIADETVNPLYGSVIFGVSQMISLIFSDVANESLYDEALELWVEFMKYVDEVNDYLTFCLPKIDEILEKF